MNLLQNLSIQKSFPSAKEPGTKKKLDRLSLNRQSGLRLNFETGDRDKGIDKRVPIATNPYRKSFREQTFQFAELDPQTDKIFNKMSQLVKKRKLCNFILIKR